MTEEKADGVNNTIVLDSPDVLSSRNCCPCPRVLGKIYPFHPWLPIKVHYFLMFAIPAGVLPLLPIIGKDIGLNATAVGIVYTLQPIFVFSFKPLLGYISDYFQNIKYILMILLAGSVLILTAALFIDPIQQADPIYLEIYTQYSNKSNVQKNLSSEFDEACIRNLNISDEIICEISNRSASSNLTFGADFNFDHNNDNANANWKNGEYSLNPNTSITCFILWQSNFSGLHNNNYSLTIHDKIFETCHVSNIDAQRRFYNTPQFWFYLIIVLIIGVFYTSSMILTDVSCYDILGDKKEYYGRQRLWGTVSTGIVMLLVGYLHHIIARPEDKTKYFAGYYFMFTFFALDMMLLIAISLPKSNLSQNIFSDVKKIFQSANFVVFAMAVFFIGVFSGLLANYLLWYLETLGATQTLLGFIIAAQCLLTEVPFFFFSGRIVKYLGYYNCLTCSFVAFALRFGLYSLLRDPWMALPIETLHGFSFAVFYASKTAFVADYAVPGTEGTVLGIMSGIFDGLGYATGSLLGGVGFDNIGGSNTFLAASLFSLICVPLSFLAHFVFKKRMAKDFQCVNTRENFDHSPSSSFSHELQ